jgi:hypothetical protein
VAGKYRALLIGNSTYPVDEHNLQTLKGPVKDIAVLNRALVDRDTGLFADVDVTLLPEATSARAVRALGKFFGTADRDDVLLVYFSGHGKLDQRGRLHLCMQDTDSTDLLSTALSSTRINEFADASRAGNVVIVLDCCYAGAFRGADLADAVAGPGRYVLTSCRGTQLANDATIENGTSLFTQHLVDGLLEAAVDHDDDGYVGFSDLYAYVDRRLRDAGKQIPQRRVNGDGDLRLAKRPQQAQGKSAADPGAPGHAADASPPDPAPVDDNVDTGRAGTGTPTAAAGKAPPTTRRRVLPAAAAAAVLVAAGGVIAALVLPHDGGAGPTPSADGGLNGPPSSYTSDSPWRLVIEDKIRANDQGCTITLTDVNSGASTPLPAAAGTRATSLYGNKSLQIHQAGSFRWQANDPGCLVSPRAGPGDTTLPFIVDQTGDSDAFLPPPRVAVQVKDYMGNQTCHFKLYDAADGQTLDSATATPGADTVLLNSAGRQRVYLGYEYSCAYQVSAATE